MDGIPLGYSSTADVDADFFEYSGVNIPPTDNINARSLFCPQASSSDQLSLQGTTQQSSWQQNVYRTSNQQSSLCTSSFEGVGVSASAVFVCQSQY
jgi:hypothetical protein